VFLSLGLNEDGGALSMDDFLVQEHEEAQELAAQPFGATLLHHVGMIYTLRAEAFLGSQSTFMGIGGAAANLKQRHHTAKTHIAAVGAAWGAFKAARNMDIEGMDEMEEGSDAAKAAEAKAAENMPAMLNAMWRVTVIDVERTLKVVCTMVLSDESVNNEQAKVRAEGMRRLGRLYSAAADTAQGGAKKRAEKHKSAMSFMATGGGFGGEKCPGEYEHHEYGDATDQSDFDESRGASNVPVTASQLSRMSAKDIKRLLAERGIAYDDCVEKRDLIRRYFEETGA